MIKKLIEYAFIEEKERRKRKSCIILVVLSFSILDNDLYLSTIVLIPLIDLSRHKHTRTQKNYYFQLFNFWDQPAPLFVSWFFLFLLLLLLFYIIW